LGQSIWLDNISRDLISSGGLQRLVDLGLLGVTSNPTIFEKAITGSGDYDAQLRDLARAGKSPAEIFEALAVRDIQQAADVLRPVYDRLEGIDGYVSLEVSPRLAHDTEGTIVEAERLWRTVDRPNVFIKIPGTAAGLPAISATLARGINVNVTLLFDVDRYEDVALAYMEGLERYGRDAGSAASAASAASGAGSLSRVASVASFFVSRVDAMVDAQLEGRPEAATLQGVAAVANAQVAYERFQSLFGAPRFAALERQGARQQRVLWASTSTKNPNYPDLKYVDSLIGPHTVNTVPAPTLEAILDHVTVRPTIHEGLAEAHAQLEALAEAGISMKAVAAKLETDGVEQFAKSYDALLQAIEKKARQVA
jgi:transaldolase/transaldolase/glucose-6-phosphate isomerase